MSRFEAKPPLETKPIVHGTLPDVKAWAQKELEFWSALSGALGASPYTPNSNWSAAETALRSLTELHEDEDENLDAAQSLFSTAVENLKLTSRDPRAGFVASLKESGESDGVLAATLAALIDPTPVSRHLGHNRFGRLAIQGLVYRAAFHSSPTKAQASGVKRSISKTLGEAQSLLGAIQADHETAVTRLENFESSVTASLEDAGRELDKALEDFTVKRNALEEKLTTELSLRAPVDYWTGKEAYHGERATVYRWWFVAVAGIGSVGLTLLAWRWLVPVMSQSSDAWWTLVLFSGLVGFWAWPLRLTSKLYLSHRHLAEDSHERGVVAKTFLALNEVVDLSESDRHILLAALFRPATGGLVKDEGALNWTDVLVARMGGRD